MSNPMILENNLNQPVKAGYDLNEYKNFSSILESDILQNNAEDNFTPLSLNKNEANKNEAQLRNYKFTLGDNLRNFVTGIETGIGKSVVEIADKAEKNAGDSAGSLVLFGSNVNMFFSDSKYRKKALDEIGEKTVKFYQGAEKYVKNTREKPSKPFADFFSLVKNVENNVVNMGSELSNFTTEWTDGLSDSPSKARYVGDSIGEAIPKTIALAIAMMGPNKKNAFSDLDYIQHVVTKNDNLETVIKEKLIGKEGQKAILLGEDVEPSGLFEILTRLGDEKQVFLAGKFDTKYGQTTTFIHTSGKYDDVDVGNINLANELEGSKFKMLYYNSPKRDFEQKSAYDFNLQNKTNDKGVFSGSIGIDDDGNEIIKVKFLKFENSENAQITIPKFRKVATRGIGISIMLANTNSPDTMTHLDVLATKNDVNLSNDANETNILK